MNNPNRAQQVAANAILRERIELVRDADTREALHKQHCAFVHTLNLAFERQTNG